jgi:hypothetical protein
MNSIKTLFNRNVIVDGVTYNVEIVIDKKHTGYVHFNAYIGYTDNNRLVVKSLDGGSDIAQRVLTKMFEEYN